MFYKQLNIIFGVSLYICDTLLAQLRNKADLKVKGERIAQLSTLHCALPVPLPVPVPALFKNLSFSKHIDYGQPGRKISVFLQVKELFQKVQKSTEEKGKKKQCFLTYTHQPTKNYFLVFFYESLPD